MASYSKSEAREWARQEMRGVCNVLIPTVTSDFRDLNEEAARFDVRRDIELGFLGALAVSETNVSHDEYIRFIECSADEAKGRLKIIFHASFDSLEDNIELANRAEQAGAEFVLLSYPPTFYPKSEEDIYDYTTAFCQATNLAVMLFPVPLWGFERIHPASLSIDLMERLVDEQPNIAAIKAEGGMPSLAGFTEAWNRLGDQVVISMPLEWDAIPLATIIPLQLIATSNTEWLGDRVPRMLSMIWDGKTREAMELFWSCDPLRRANANVGGTGGANAVHRMAWKYQAWLNGFNGGPLRQPTARLVSPQMRGLRAAAAAAGVLFDDLPDSDFFVGRNPA